MAASPVNSSPPLGQHELAELILQMQDLQKRVRNLEVRLGATVTEATSVAAPPQLPSTFGLPPNTVTIAGRMLLAIAGAYVLRTLTDWHILPLAAGVGIGLVYAFVWLWLAARSPVEARFTAALSCVTSMLIMGPLVWEAAERFKVMSSGASSAVITVFALGALTLGSLSPHRIIGSIGGISSIVLAAALLLVRDDIVPFTTALLVIAAGMELAAWRDRPARGRAFAALAADSAVLLFSYLMSSPRGMPETWIPTSRNTALIAQFALILIYLGTALNQSVVRRKTLAFAEIVQTGLALLIGFGGAVRVFGGYPAVTLSLGISALAGGIAFYVVSFLLFERDNKRNFRALSTFGLLLLSAGMYLPLPRLEFWILSSVCAVACCWAARLFALPTLGLHGAFYLTLGSAFAGAIVQPLAVFFSIGSGARTALPSVGVLLALVLSWVAVSETSPSSHGYRRNQISSLMLAALGIWISAGVATDALIALVWKGAGGVSSGIPTDTLGTVVLVSFALGLAWAGTRWRKRELVWVLYGLMALGAYKLATRDFVDEHNFAMVVSLLSYGGALVILPRLLRGRRINAEP